MKGDRLLLGLALLVALAVFTYFVIGFLGSEGDDRVLYLLLAGTPIVLALMVFPRAALIVLALLIFVVRWLYDTWSIVPRETTWLIDLLLVLLVFRSMLLSPRRKEPLRREEKYAFGILGFMFLSSVLNGASPITLLIGIRGLFRYTLLFMAVYHLYISEEWLYRFLKLLFVVGLVQTPINLYLRQELEWYDWDRLSGTFGWGQTPGLAFFILVLISYLVSKIIEQKRLRFTYVIAFLWLAVCPFLGEVKFFFLFVPVLIVFMVRAEALRRPFMAFGMLVFGLIIVFGMDYVVRTTGYWSRGTNPINFVRTIPQQFSREMEISGEDQFERSWMFVKVFRVAASTPKRFLIGFGPGSITETTFADNPSPWISYLARYGISQIRISSILWLLVELGYAGTILFFGLFWLIFRRGRVLRASDNEQTRIYGRMLESMVFCYVTWVVYGPAIQSDNISYTFWVIAAILVRLSYVEEARQKAAQNGVKSGGGLSATGTGSRPMVAAPA